MSRKIKKFVAPTTKEQKDALPLHLIDEKFHSVFYTSKLFAPIPEPQPDDWLANFEEPRESLQSYSRSRYNKVLPARKTIYLLPIGNFPPAISPSLQTLHQFSELFFQLPTTLLRPLIFADDDKCGDKQGKDKKAGKKVFHTYQYYHPTVGKKKIKVKVRHGNNDYVPQYFADDLFAVLRAVLPSDAYCLVGVTMEDLYPDEKWNFVFGQASMRERIGVFSFARYSPYFDEPEVPAALTEKDQQLLLKRSCSVLAHEALHMFGIGHCVYYHCLMNGANNLEESDRGPLFLCPIDLAKFHKAVGFSPKARYEALLAFYEKHLAFVEEASWLQKRIKEIKENEQLNEL